MPVSYSTKAASAAIKAGPGWLYSVVVTAAADAASVTIYDNTAGSGAVVAVIKAAIQTSVVWSPPEPIACNTGIYATITGTSPSVSVAFL